MPIKDESQTAGRQHPIPQNVMDVEFKVVGDITLRQLMYLFAGAILAYIVYKSGAPAFWRYLIVFLTVTGTIAIAFVPYEERGLDKWFMSFIRAMTAPTQMVWRKTYSPPAYFLSDYANIIKNEIITLTPAKSRNKLDDYLGQLSESQNDLDRIEAARLQSIRMGFSTQAGVSVVTQQAAPSSFSPSLGGGPTTDVIFADEPTAPGRSMSDTHDGNAPHAEIQPVHEKAPEPPEQTKPTTTESPKPQPTQPKPETKPEQNQENFGSQKLQQAPKNVEQKPITSTQAQQPKPQTKPVSPEQKEALKAIKEDEASSKKELLDSIEFKKPTLGAPAVDRAIINIPSNPKGEIKINLTTKLPKVIVVQDLKEIQTKESSLEKRVGELLEVATQVRSEMQAAADKEAHRNKNQGRIEFFNTKYQELEKERAKITTQLDESTSQVQQIGQSADSDLTKQVHDLSIKNEELKAQLAQIQEEINILRATPQQTAKPAEPVKAAAQQPKKPEPTPAPPRNSDQAQSLNQVTQSDYKPEDPNKKAVVDANLITGTVKNKKGELIDNAVVIIKDKDGDAIRALKTNQLGQFKTQTPMQNGKYTVETIKGGMKFDIISVEAKGQPISPLSIIAFE